MSSTGSDDRKKREEEGAFNRPASTFRDTIEKGGKFEPEKCKYYYYYYTKSEI